jgi:hypothetical protein
MSAGMPRGPGGPGRRPAYFETQYLVLQACSTRFKLVTQPRRRKPAFVTHDNEASLCVTRLLKVRTVTFQVTLQENGSLHHDGH